MTENKFQSFFTLGYNDYTLENFKVEAWDKPKVLEIFKELNFNRYIDRFSLRENQTTKSEEQEELYKTPFPVPLHK